MNYKIHYIKLLYEFVIFALTLNIVASMYQAWEKANIPLIQRMTQGRSILVDDFIHKHNVSRNIIKDLVQEIQKTKHVKTSFHSSSLSYIDAFILILSLFSTVGWSHIYPKSIGGKLFCIIGSCFGIPTTFAMIHTGAKIFIRHLVQIIRICLADNIVKFDRQIEKRINISVRAWLIPSLIISIFIYMILTAFVVAGIGNVSYYDSLYYCFITLTTIGMGNFMKSNHVFEHRHPSKSVGMTIFLMLWTVFGIIIIASIVLSILNLKQNHQELLQRDLCQKYNERLHGATEEQRETNI